MTDFLFGYYGLGLRALDAARLGLHVAGENIANVNTPGYAKRRVDLATGMPFAVKGGFLDQGVDVETIRRVQDRFLQASVEREQGSFGRSDELLRGLRDIESSFGTIDGESIQSALNDFSASFAELAGRPEEAALRRSAIDAADRLAQQFRSTWGRLDEQRRTENGAVDEFVAEANRLAEQLAALNREVFAAEAGGDEAGSLREQRQQVIEQLADLTGGKAVPADGGKLRFDLPSGTTLVTGEDFVGLRAVRNAEGLTDIYASDGTELTDRIRSGRLGSLLALRDEDIPARQAALDQLAAAVMSRANALTTSAFDVDGVAGGPLFEPDPPAASGSARQMVVAAALLSDPDKLAISADGAPGDGSIAVSLSQIPATGLAGLAGKSPTDFLSDVASALAGDIVQADVDASVSANMLDTLTLRRESLSGVSLDEEAVELMRSQRAYEAAARFIQVLNEVTEIAVNLR